MSILIKNARLLDPSSGFDGVRDIFIENNIISRVASDIITDADYYIDARGMWAAPGLIDVHCHLREPGFEYKETIATGARSAAIGGFTTICAMPNTNPPIDSTDRVEYIKDKAAEVVINVLPIGAITLGMEGRALTDFAGLKKSGACAVSEDGKTVEDAWLMLKAMLTASENGLPVLCHCEDKSISDGGVMNPGDVAAELGLKGIPDEAEDTVIARDLELQAQSGAKLHICHVSTKGGVELIRNAKKEGRSVTAEVCPHHFSLTDFEIARKGADAKMAPPLRDADDVAALIGGLTDGTLDIIATDHAPHSKKEKMSGINNAPFGIVGFETALPLAVTNLVNKGYLTPLQMIEKMSLNPARLLGIDRGTAEEGKAADIVIIDPNYEYVVDINKFASKSNNCPYDGMRLKGKVFASIVSGKLIINNYEEV